MNSIVQASIEAQLAMLTKEQGSAPLPLGYGTDSSCITDTDAFMTEVDPFSNAAVGQAFLRRITTPRLSVIDDDDYGIDVRQYLNRGTSLSALQDIGQKVRGEGLKDDRIADLTVTATMPTFQTLRISCLLKLQQPYGSQFALVFSVTSSQVLIETLG